MSCRHNQRSALIAASLPLLLLLCCLVTTTDSTSAAADAAATVAGSGANQSSVEPANYNCPEDCACNLAENTHTPFLHAKCSSLRGLLSDAPLETTLPLHSIDLSYLRLPRLAHSLEKLTDVTSVDLSHNELHEIGHLGRRIKKLNLRHNRITSAKLSKMPQHVQVLNLQSNDITYLPLDFMKLVHLRSLELSHNEINCSCETLEVRNWLQSRHVFMESAVTCSQPIEVQGQPWLQVRQADICEREKRRWSVDEDENELMLGDSPYEGSGDRDEDEELGKAFLPLASTAGPRTGESQWIGDVEGSGDLGRMNMEMSITTLEPVDATDIDENDEGSGSGGYGFVIPAVFGNNHADDDFDTKPIEQPDGDEQSPAIFGAGMGIFDDPNADNVATEDPIVPVQQSETQGIDPSVVTDGPPDMVKHASVRKQDDSNATYFLLGVIILIVVGLILFVGIKRCKHSGSGSHDVENPRQTELLDMDKKNPGKPIRFNGLEHSPLIAEKSKSDLAKPINGAGKKPYESADVNDGPGPQQPLLNGHDKGGKTNNADDANAPEQAAQPNSNELSPHEYYPITPRYPTPKSPRASKYAQYPQNNEPNNNNNNNNNTPNDQYLPSSPKSGRYSPVYSPETGRVKIKLTETPRPKTPMLVTRSRSNAGDIITTPVRMGAVSPVAPAAVHAPSANANDTANGNLSY